MVAELDVEALYVALDAKRRALRLKWRAIGRDLCLSSSMFSRMGQGCPPSADHLCRLLLWLGDTDLKPFMRDADAS